MSISGRTALGLCGVFLACSPAAAQTFRSDRFKSDGAVVSVTLKTGVSADVPFPQAREWMDTVQAWTLDGIEFSPDATSAVVRFGLHVPKDLDTVLFLVKPDGAVMGLRNSSVWKTRWTGDGKYILGFGGNTVRVWNLNGGLRQLTFDRINDFWLSVKSLCLDVAILKDGNGAAVSVEYIQTYSVPMLKRIGSVPALEKTHCEHRP